MRGVGVVVVVVFWTVSFLRRLYGQVVRKKAVTHVFK